MTANDPKRSFTPSAICDCKPLIPTVNPNNDDMNWPSVDDFRSPRAKGRYLAILRLQGELNRQLLGCYEEVQHQEIEYVSTALLSKVEELVEQLNDLGYNFGRFDYGGSKDFERSHQTYYDRKWDRHNKTLGAGLMIQFCGFAARVEWLDHQKKEAVE